MSEPRSSLDVVRLGNGTPIDVVTAEQTAGMGFDRPFSPGSPLEPFAGYSTTPRSMDFLTGYNIAARPRRNEHVSFDTLRGMVRSYDVAQMCIWHRIDSIRALKWDLIAMPGFEGQDVEPYKQVGKRALARPDRRRPFKAWLTEFLWDTLAYDAGSLARVRNSIKDPRTGLGRCVGLQVVDGTTIAPLLDYYGNIPVRAQPGEAAPPAFVQYAQGVPWVWLTTDDLIYEPFRSMPDSPYGTAPLETILLNANTDLRFQWHFLQRFTEGNVPEAFATAPEGWTPDQIETFQQAWDAFMLGDQAGKSQIKWVPNGTGFAWSNERDFSDVFSLFLMRKTAAAYHVTPQDLGFTEDVNRATSETQVDNQFRVGDLPLVEHVQGILDGFLQDDLGLPLCFQFDTGQEKEDRLATAQADKIYVEMGAVGVSEVRERVYGLSEPDGQQVPRFVMSSRAGPIPLSALLAVAGPVDPGSGAPEPGAVLPHKPFAPVEGVAPQKPPDEPPLAVRMYPADNPTSVQAAIVNADAPVTKAEGVGVSVEGGTAATSYDLIGHDDDEHDEDETDAEVAKELAAFGRFRRARVRSGRWRDFGFEHVNPAQARRLNLAGRVEVRKAAGQVIAAGLAVVATDTGRVLMLERGLGPDDPASGMWEFPGGHLEDGESAFQAAAREWQEETGCLLPPGHVTGRWTAASGVYEGFVYAVPSEDGVPIFTRGAVNNPDDPDGDSVEALAWWGPQQLGGRFTGGQWVNPALRAELQQDVPAVLDELASATSRDETVDGTVVKAEAGGAPPKG